MIKKFLEFAIDRPVLNHLVMVLMIVMSIFAYKAIPKEIFPPSQLDQVAIAGTYAGASADVLDKMAVKGIEDELKGLAEIDTVYTTVQNGVFSISADIVSGNDNQMVLGDIKDIISKLRRDLPSDMDEPIAKIKVHNYPLILIAIAGDGSMKELVDAEMDIERIDAIVGRGGLIHPVVGGVYEVNQRMKEDLEEGIMGEHASNLGGLIALNIAESLPGTRAFIANPVVVDELHDVARISGHPDIERVSIYYPQNK